MVRRSERAAHRRHSNIYQNLRYGLELMDGDLAGMRQVWFIRCDWHMQVEFSLRYQLHYGDCREHFGDGGDIEFSIGLIA